MSVLNPQIRSSIVGPQMSVRHPQMSVRKVRPKCRITIWSIYLKIIYYLKNLIKKFKYYIKYQILLKILEY